MQHTLASHSIFWPKENSLPKQGLLILLGTIILSLAAQISIPLQPVPLTFQSVTVILLGMALGARLGGSVIALYLFCGALGLPVFANLSAGLQVFTGPTAGFLLGFLPAAIVSGYLAQRGLAKSFLGSLGIALIATTIIFAAGVGYLSHLIGLEKAYLFGLAPFIISEPLKLIALSFVAPKFWK